MKRLTNVLLVTVTKEVLIIDYTWMRRPEFYISKLLFIPLCADLGGKTQSQATSPDSCILKFHKPSEVFIFGATIGRHLWAQVKAFSCELYDQSQPTQWRTCKVRAHVLEMWAGSQPQDQTHHSFLWVTALQAGSGSSISKSAPPPAPSRRNDLRRQPLLLCSDNGSQNTSWTELAKCQSLASPTQRISLGRSGGDPGISIVNQWLKCGMVVCTDHSCREVVLCGHSCPETYPDPQLSTKSLPDVSS